MNYDSDDEREAIRERVAALYRSISGPAGVPRDWDAFASCYAPEGRITPFHVGSAGDITFDIFTVESYIASRETLFASTAFFEGEVGHAVAIEGRIAHVFSRYEARHDPAEAPFTSGVNSIQLIRLPEGWKVLSIAWQFTGVRTQAEDATELDLFEERRDEPNLDFEEVVMKLSRNGKL